MVNYDYDADLVTNRANYRENGVVPVSADVQALLQESSAGSK
jgi:hypothetical protein